MSQTATTPRIHNHGTRANSLQPRALVTTYMPADTEFALHGNAFNPDTGQIADYVELSKCSEENDLAFKHDRIE